MRNIFFTEELVKFFKNYKFVPNFNKTSLTYWSEGDIIKSRKEEKAYLILNESSRVHFSLEIQELQGVLNNRSGGKSIYEGLWGEIGRRANVSPNSSENIAVLEEILVETKVQGHRVRYRFVSRDGIVANQENNGLINSVRSVNFEDKKFGKESLYPKELAAVITGIKQTYAGLDN